MSVSAQNMQQMSSGAAGVYSWPIRIRIRAMALLMELEITIDFGMQSWTSSSGLFLCHGL